MAFDSTTQRGPDGKRQAIDLVLVAAYAFITAAFSLVPSFGLTPGDAIRHGMVLFVSGYALIAALFPGKSDIGHIERIALSVWPEHNDSGTGRAGPVPVASRFRAR